MITVPGTRGLGKSYPKAGLPVSDEALRRAAEQCGPQSACAAALRAAGNWIPVYLDTATRALVVGSERFYLNTRYPER